MTGPALSVELIAEAPGWAALDFDPAEAVEQGARMALKAAGVARGAYVVGALAADDARMAQLNEAHRGKPAPTNVLSWPAFALSAAERGLAPGARPAPPPEADPFGEPVELGDLAFALETVAREAEARGLSLRAHLVHLALHGTLHLLGYDHETEPDAALMEGLESAAMRKAGFDDPYAQEAAS
ncbi:rRNA maturation RNase YbeY [Oceanicella actignis]|uniref:rRNA maturation RNase YbeY n=1 Tax=Oceanicella actignis TaxID=1189325 RepID=UPI0012543094|nr:rRNA maturation RNase YbeY [Oceanicella actignis]TYO91214.1 putative rRNA maturation factor [Oceanicella actignis]